MQYIQPQHHERLAQAELPWHVATLVSCFGSAPDLAPHACAQTVQYIQPQHHERLAQAELLVIDEAAAIPLPLVKAMLGPYLVFLCSTVNG